MGKSAIYRIVNTTNGHEYIGSAVSVQRRWRDHRRELNRGIHHCEPLLLAWRKYGPGVFLFEIIEEVPERTALIAREQHYIDARQPYYNVAPIAGSQLGYRHNERGRRRMREARVGRTLSLEHRQHIAAAMKGVEHSDDTRAKLSQALTGRAFSEESRTKMSTSATAAWTDPNLRARHSANRTGRRASSETREKLSAMRQGHPVSQTTRDKIAAKRRAYWERRRQATAQSGEPIA